jgi:AraC family transcriptional regulator of adaptative response/methylated-DNA-[protein]-cysteine methyltransferase
LIASTPKGICHISFADDRQRELDALYTRFPKAIFIQRTDMQQQNALQIFQKDWNNLPQVKLHLKATAFQVKVWEALLKIPFASVHTYGNIADSIGLPDASRAVGTAIGSNPIAFLIPCHRVIRSTGMIGEYHWGSNRKTAMIGWEAAREFGE